MKDNTRDNKFMSDAMFADKAFHEKYQYDKKDLGARCGKEKTIFKVWSPFAEKVELCLYQDNDSPACEKKPLLQEEKGVWQITFDENLHGMYYDYVVEIDGRETRTADPYAVGCGCNGERSMVVDLKQTNPPGFEEDTAPPMQEEQIIYELHIKDFSYDAQSGVPKQYQGKYKAFTIDSTNSKYPTCMKYLKELGVTHVQLLPFFDYASVDEAGDGKQYNWGYDPLNYNVPEGSYATDVKDGTVRIRECKEMIQAFHANGIRVVMDVVYNHTYREDSWLQRMVPGYYYRHREDGSLTDGSACGNDVAAGRAMVDNYIADSVMYWAKEYHIDGFRFDLMGLLTVDLMNRIRRELDEAFGKGEKLIYGEPWSADSSPMEKGLKAALKENTCYLDDGIGIFCDNTRDLIKGDAFHGEEPGAVNGGSGLESLLLDAVTGWRSGGADFCPKSCAQIINYVSAHDNFTLWDKLVLSMCPKPDFLERNEEVMAANKLAAFIYFTCQGRLFMQAGEEFGRTKFGEGNSYRSAPEINMLRWHRTVEFAELVDYYKGLIRLRKRLPGLCDKSAAAVERIKGKAVHGKGVVSFLVDNRTAKGAAVTEADHREAKSAAIREANHRKAEGVAATETMATREANCRETEGVAVTETMTIREANRRETEGVAAWDELCVIYNVADQECRVALEKGVWQILADGERTDCRKAVAGAENGIRVKPHSGMLLGKCNSVLAACGKSDGNEG